MSKSKSTVRKARKAKREAAEDRADRVHGGLLGARAAVMTTIIALEGKTRIEGEIATNLRCAALRQLDAAIEFVGGRPHG
jgi:hypothetical protein